MRKIVSFAAQRVGRLPGLYRPPSPLFSSSGSFNGTSSSLSYSKIRSILKCPSSGHSSSYGLNCAPQFQSSVYKCLSDVLRSFQPKSFSDTSSEASSLAASNKVIKTEASSLAASKFQVQRSEASSLAASDSKIKRSQATSYKASVPSSKSSSLCQVKLLISGNTFCIEQ